MNTLRSFTKGGAKLNPFYVTGLTDGDGHFGFNFHHKTHKVHAEFKITSHAASYGVLQDLKSFFGVGRLNIDNRKDETMKFIVSSIDDLINVVIPHFRQYPLLGSKNLNFLAWCEGVELMHRGGHLTPEGWNHLLLLASGMNKKRSFAYKYNYFVNTTISPTLDYLRGFVDAEGLFYCYIPLTGQPQFSLEVAQATHDIMLLFNLSKLIGGGYLKPVFDIHSLSEAQQVAAVSRLIVRQTPLVIGIFDEYPLLTTKALDYDDWKRLVVMYRNGDHLTAAGRAAMIEIKKGMNNGRPKCTIASLTR